LYCVPHLVVHHRRVPHAVTQGITREHSPPTGGSSSSGHSSVAITGGGGGGGGVLVFLHFFAPPAASAVALGQLQLPEQDLVPAAVEPGASVHTTNNDTDWTKTKQSRTSLVHDTGLANGRHAKRHATLPTWRGRPRAGSTPPRPTAAAPGAWRGTGPPTCSTLCASRARGPSKPKTTTTT
jgi:hypothetical protein